MASLVVRTPKLTDGEIRTIVKDLLSIDPDGTATINYAAGQSRKATAKEPFMKPELSEKSRIIVDVHFKFGGTVQETVAFHRGIVEPEIWQQHPNQSGFSRSQPSAYFDELGFLEVERNYNPNPPTHDKLSSEQIFSVSRLISSWGAEGAAVGNAESASLSDIVLGQIHELRSLHVEMTAGLAQARVSADKELARRTKQLDDEHSQRASQLAERETELEVRRRALNDREPQHERRRLREHLTERLQQTIAEPRQATGARERQSNYLYLIVAAIFVAISVGLAAYADVDLANSSAAFWARSLKSLASGVAGAAFAWAGLSGLKKSAVAAREYEQAMQRYAFDMDRASWVVETILQMNANEEATVPEEWLESVCRDLFVNGSRTSDKKESLEAFAALFDATAKARIGTNGLEFEIDRKGARKLAEQ